MAINARLTELASIKGAPTPVVSVYLNTRWADEQQRDRARVFLKNGLRKARRAKKNRATPEDLDWVQSEGASLVDQARYPDANGVALFACIALGVRDVLPIYVPFENAFVVAEAPFLRPLVTVLEESPSTLVVFVDSESARLIPLTVERTGDEVVLESEVPGHHRRGGWAQLAQSRYQRHIQDHRGRHFEAVAAALGQLTQQAKVARIVLAGEPRTISAFRKHLPNPIAERIAGIIPAARYEPASTIASRAAEFLAHLEMHEESAAVDAVLVEAAKGGQAVAGVGETLEALGRGAVRRLYLLKGFSEGGQACVECEALQGGPPAACPLCGKETRAIDLGEAMVDRVLRAGGGVEMIAVHGGLSRVGGVAALLRYPL
jgi:peptide subunit release factor 1 (eRF1)